MDQKVYDEEGVWVVNTGLYRFVDPVTGNFFEPGVRTKVKLNDWLESQPVIQKPEPEPEQPAKQEPTKKEAKT